MPGHAEAPESAPERHKERHREMPGAARKGLPNQPVGPNVAAQWVGRVLPCYAARLGARTVGVAGGLPRLLIVRQAQGRLEAAGRVPSARIPLGLFA